MQAKVLNSYSNGGTVVTLLEDGTKIRQVLSDVPSVFPESIDIKITNWCDAGCAYCHEKSTRRGQHGDLNRILNLVKQLPAGTELAIGGGHPLAHPDIDDFLKEVMAYGLIPNLTINEYHFDKELPRIERLVADKLVYGVGYSYSTKPCLWQYDNLISHIIIGVTSPEDLEKVIRVNNKVLLLGYKTFGRGEKYAAHFSKEVKANIDYWYRYLFKAAKLAHLSFDNLAIEQLNPKRVFANQEDYDRFYMGNDGSYTMYIDGVKQEYAITSTGKTRYLLIGNLSIKDIFSHVRTH